jgi:thiamine kinase-like enzyme
MIIQKIKDLFNLDIISSTPFKRNDSDEVVNLLLESHDGKMYFLKEVQSHSLRDDLDYLYSSLSQLKTERFHLVLPICINGTPSQFKFEFENKVFLLFKRENLKPFLIENYPLSKLLSDLIFFQSLIEKFSFSKSDYRNYRSWIEMGPKRFRKMYDENLPFLDMFEKFIDERFANIKFENGNIHWDVHRDNLALDESGKLIILDFDLVQEGALITDIASATSMYIDFECTDKSKNEHLYQEAYNSASILAKEMTISDFKFLVKRCVLGDWALIESIDELKYKLKNLEF